MKFCSWRKDGGPESRVHGFFLVEIKPLFSIVLLRFSDGSRHVYHTHAFNSVNWLLKGHLREFDIDGRMPDYHWPSFRPIWTPREKFHMVSSRNTSWVLSFRGPWASRWLEYVPSKGAIVLENGRKEVR